MEKLTHTLSPIFDASSEILILGSFPSKKSRETCFYYGNPQNRFFRVLASLRNAPLPADNEEKKAFLLRNHIALWDVIASCEITGSSDASIKNALPNDLSQITSHAPIKAVFLNGKTALRLYQKYLETQTGLVGISLPSTSPANAAWNLEKLTDAWSVINTYLS